LQRNAGACETAHDRPHRYTNDFGSLLVAEPIDGHEQQRRALIWRQAVDRPPHLLERKPRLDPANRLVRSQPLFGNLATLLPDVPRADLIDPDRLHDAKHPAVEPRALLKLMLAREGALARRLNQIVGFDGGACQSTCKPPQPWQDRDQLIAKTHGHRIIAWYQVYRRSRQFLTKQQRTSRRFIPGTLSPR